MDETAGLYIFNESVFVSIYPIFAHHLLLSVDKIIEISFRENCLDGELVVLIPPPPPDQDTVIVTIFLACTFKEEVEARTLQNSLLADLCAHGFV